jgi:anaerobic magnesium-protoporphyrin IX monomethyl ester cyclase
MRILLVNPPNGIEVYKNSKIFQAITNSPFLAVSVLAATARQAGAKVAVLDLGLSSSPNEDLLTELERFKPDMVGVTFTSQLYYEGQAIAAIVKKHNPRTITICGGIHASFMPEETLAEGDFDIACIGEGDITIAELAAGHTPESVNGLVIKRNGNFIHTPPRKLIANLDDLPFPAFDLYPIHRYKSPRLSSRRDPVVAIETNRGCPYRCTYCGHVIGFGHKVRYKSPERAVDEFFCMRKLGFNDIHIRDENFTTDLDRAKRICELLITRGWDRPWSMPSGVRVKDVDQEFVNLAVRSGCYGIGFGVESGDEKILAGVNKKQDLHRVAEVIDMCTKAGMVTKGFFMMGLPNDTKETMEKTINFACSLNLTFAKTSVTLPVPGSDLFDEYERKGLILSHDWSKYNTHTAPEVYRHETLEWSTIRHYYDKFYRRFYLRPRYIARRILSGIASGEIARDVKSFFNTDWV